MSEKSVGEAPPRRVWWRRPPVLVAAGLGALALLYGLDLAVSAGEVPRGVSVAGVPIGGLGPDTAEQRLRDTLTPRMATPVQVIAGDHEARFVPASVGIDVDWAASVAQAGSQPVNPWTRLVSLFNGRDLDVVARGDQNALDRKLEELRAQVDRDAVEGDIRFDGTTPIEVQPRAGQRLDLAAARNALLAESLRGSPITLPVAAVMPKATAEGVRAALDGFARPAVSGPATVEGDGRSATVDQRAVANALSFQATDNGELTPKLDKARLPSLVDQLAPTERAGQDARITFDTGKPTVVPSTEGRVIDWDRTLSALLRTLGHTDKRVAEAEYTTAPAKLTTDQLNGLGIKEIIGEFSTGGFAQDSGVNIQVVATKVNGAVVKPGDTFSLNGHTGPRGTAQGYVEAAVIEDGLLTREVGGGISQFATTLYNAAYFAGMTDTEHKEHSFYVSRYPAGREATVFQRPDGSSAIDLKFTNEGRTGVAIQPVWTTTSITVRLWGTKQVTVESVPGPRVDYVNPPTVTKPAGPDCKPARGQQGFTTTDTRVVRDLGGKEINRITRTIHYNPAPTVVCTR